MALSKVTYVDGETVIYASNLNDIQDEIIDIADSVDDIGPAITNAQIDALFT